MDSILGMALQLPALKSIGESIGYDFSGALPKSGGAGRGDQEDGGITPARLPAAQRAAADFIQAEGDEGHEHF